MKRGSTLFLRAVLVLMALVALAVCIFALPSIYQGVPKEYAVTVSLLNLCIGGLYLSAIPFFIALYQAFRLLNFIDKNTAFSVSSVNALKYIKYCAIAISVLYAAGIPF